MLCFKFGHISKYCRNKSEIKTCANCKGQHDTKACEIAEDNFICINCPTESNKHRIIQGMPNIPVPERNMHNNGQAKLIIY